MESRSRAPAHQTAPPSSRSDNHSSPLTQPSLTLAVVQELSANVASGHVLNNPTVQLSFPEDNSQASQLARLNAAAVTLRNLKGPSVGCSDFSSLDDVLSAAEGNSSRQDPNSVAQQSPAPTASAPASASSAAAAPPAAAAAHPALSPASSSGIASAAQIAQLAPNLGFTSGKNPTGTGNCDGAVNGANDQPIKIPCSCLPSQADFVTVSPLLLGR
jgi:hypothetical protein